LKPRKINKMCMIFTVLLLCIFFNSTRAYTAPYVQPLANKELLPGAKEPLILIKKIKGHATGYFGPKKGEYKTRLQYLKATAMNGEGKKTKSGTTPRIGTIAADTRFYPFGTKIFIPELKFLGTVEDIGSGIKGPRRIDIFCGHGKSAEKVARNLGKRAVTLVIVAKS
jgi:3D (Asp-Asp-Asp) domain-containing protein